MIAVLSEKISKRFEEITGIESYGLKPFCSLDTPVGTHADMLICKIENNVFCYKKYAENNALIFEKIKNLGYNVICVEKECKREYPDDVALNVLVMGKTLFCKKSHTATEIIDFATKNGYEIIDVKQGYAACSTVVLDENNAITSDKSIEKAIKKEGKNAVLISTENIKLEGYNCGFIGGSSGTVNGKFFLFGKLEKLQFSDEIEKLLLELNLEKIEIIPEEVCDFGGVKFF